jgi:CBS domain containing-hemolysin-like protein
MVLLVFYLLLALVVSFLCSVLEAVLLSITPSFIQTKLSEKKKWAEQLLKFKTHIDGPLAAILSLNTIAHTVGAAGVGAQAAIVFSNVSVGIISGVLTLLILVFSELIPKTLGASYWKDLALFTTKTLQVLNILMYPLVILSNVITKLLKNKNEPSVERSEIIALAEIGVKEGVFAIEEAKVLKNLINLRKLTVRDIMTPRMVMTVADESLTVKDFFEKEEFYRFSRIPICKNGSKDEIAGFVHKHDVMIQLGNQAFKTPLHEIRRNLDVVPDVQNLYALYDFFTKENTHIALVVEEFGGTAGIVTMEDVLETLLGMEIMDEFDSTEDLQEYARKRWKLRAKRLGINIDVSNDSSTNSEDE